MLVRCLVGWRAGCFGWLVGWLIGFLRLGVGRLVNDWLSGWLPG